MMPKDKWTETEWAEWYEGGKWNRDGGNMDSLAIMMKLMSELLGSPMKDTLDSLGKWHRDKEDDNKVYASRAKVLDYGCGEGDGTMVLKSMFPFATVKGVDIWPGAIERAKERWSEKDVIWKVGDVTVPDEAAHIIISTCTIDHIDDIGGTIERLRDLGT